MSSKLEAHSYSGRRRNEKSIPVVRRMEWSRHPPRLPARALAFPTTRARAMDDRVNVPIGDEFDLHAFAPRDIPSVVDAYLDAAYEKGLRHVRLVHGRGVQRAVVHRLLRAHRLVSHFADDAASHLGATLVSLVARAS